MCTGVKAIALLDPLLDWLATKLSHRLPADGPPPHLEKSVGERVIRSMFPSGAYTTTTGWSDNRAEQVRHYKHWTYIAVRAISQKVAQLRPSIGIVGDGATPQAKRRLSKALTHLQPHEDVIPVRDSHPLRRLLNDPNAPDSSMDFWTEAVMFLELTGSCYVWCVPNDNITLPTGSPGISELWVIPSHWVWPRAGENELVAYYDVRPWGGTSAGGLKIPACDMVHIRFKSPISKIDGYSPLTAGSEWVDVEESISKARFAQFKNGCRPELHVKLSEQFQDPTDDDLDRIYRKFFARFQGEGKTGLPIITPPGADLAPLSLTPVEMAYVQSEDQIRDMILSLYGVPKTVAGISTDVNRASMEASLAAFCMFTINPLLAFLGQVLTEKLAHRYDSRLRVYWEDCTPPDPAQLNADIEVDAKYGAITPNEQRAIRGREPYKLGGDDPLVATGMSPLPLNSGEDFTTASDAANAAATASRPVAPPMPRLDPKSWRPRSQPRTYLHLETNGDGH